MKFLKFEQIEKLTEAQKDAYAKELFQHFRSTGFPHFVYPDGHKYKIFNRLKRVDLTKEWEFEDDKVYTSFYVLGIEVASSFFPHMQSIQSFTSEKKTSINVSPLDIFNDDEKLYKQIRKMMRWYTVDPNTLRNFLKYGFNAKRVSNFRPVAAMAMWQKYMTPGSDTIWDPSMGFGGRLMGALASDRVKKYIGTDPATETFNCLMQMSDFYEGTPGKIIQTDPARIFVNKKTRLINSGSEDVLLHMDNNDMGKVGCVFTSSPYFAQEIYSHEETQSWKKFDTHERWMRGFLRTTLLNAKEMLAKDGYIIWNIDNVSSYPNLVDDMMKMIAEDEKDNGCGLVLRDTLYLKLGSIQHLNMSKVKKRLEEQGVDTKNFDMKPAGAHKKERIFVMQRKGDKHWATWEKQKTLF